MKPSKALTIKKHEAQLRVYGELTWSCFEYWTRNKEWWSWMMKLNDEGIFFAIVCVLARVPRVSIPLGLRPANWCEVIWNIEQGTRNEELEWWRNSFRYRCSRSCPASEHTIRPPACELMWGCFEYWTRNKEWGSWMMKEFFSLSLFSLASREWAYH
jgi:hypothetical protein